MTVDSINIVQQKTLDLKRFNGFILRWSSQRNGYWFESEDGRLVRADHSGDDRLGEPMGPRATEDGPLYVVTTHKANKHPNPRSNKPSYSITVTKKNGDEYSVCLGPNEAAWLFKCHPDMKPD